MYNPLKIYRREWPGVALTAIVLGTLHALSISKFLPLFSHHLHGGLWKVFIEHYHISGYDPKMYSIITRWSTEYDVSRHPLLNLLLYPLYHFNKWLMQQTGINCMQFIVAALLLACAVYSFVYLFRILSRVLRLSWADSMLLSGLFFSLAYVELALLVPDHFALSMTLLLYTLYVAGMKMRNGRGFRVWQAALLLTVTAGTTLTNGVKTLMALIATNYRRLLGWRMMLLGIVVPSLLLVGLSRYQTYTFAMPRLAAMKKANAAKPTDSVQLKKNQMVRENLASRPYIDKGPLAMTDASTPRVATAVENLFGESLQFHEDYFLCDISNGDNLRPVFVGYRHWWNYAAEVLCVVLLAAGLWVARKKRFMLLTAGFFCFDMLLHFVLGFAVNEIYIMTAHWSIVIPVALGYLLRMSRYTALWRTAIAVLTTWLFIHNTGMLFSVLQA